ncbi:hypothetical protein [Cupriavidus sp. UME77]|uniref:hypothetical protein n=1 Tax=Cupriavidus sp. UME77 TaxID=1862321 RepID=UPI001C7E7C12|nr:hypothetical protein [Cupriavidus sp. UME77]
MTAIVYGYPTESELREKIEFQLGWRGKTEIVALIWRGHLSGLLESGFIAVDVFNRLCAMLTKIDCKAFVELFLDDPIAPELDREIEELMRKSQ